jgi:bacterioferritin
MKGNATVLKHLSIALENEIVALNQYYLHSKMLKNWGFIKLADKYYQESIEEMKHADVLIERILFLEGRPNMELSKLNIGSTVPKMFDKDLKLEQKAIKDLKAAIIDSDKHKDFASQSIFQQILDEEEPHVEWIEAQIGLIDKLGLEIYLQSQL